MNNNADIIQLSKELFSIFEINSKFTIKTLNIHLIVNEQLL